MDGTIRSYLPAKGYGFVRGNDNRDYFLHQSDISPGTQVLEGQRIRFEEAATPKGYRAKNVQLLDRQPIEVRYQIPDGVLLSKEGQPRQWEIVDRCRWTIHASGRGSPDDVRTALKHKASLIGANAVLGVTYHTTTSSSGNYRYTIHNFTGIPVMLGRVSTAGVSLESLAGLEGRAALLKRELVAKTEASFRTALIVGGTIAGLGFLLGIVAGSSSGASLALALAGAGLFIGFLCHTNHDKWLERL
ncbi:MAG: cold shock domain-containing protein [Pseudoxanthomonas sp.]|nr:cold shock domain-containing protein [Pseudoxanthomonas sp.]